MKTQTAHSIEGAAGASANWELYRLISETAADAIIVIDAGSRICFANPAAQKMFGYGPELVGQSLTILIPEPNRDRHTASLDKYKKTGQKNIDWSGVELVALHRSGREIPVEISFAEAILDGGRFYVGYVRDITQRKQQEVQARQQAQAMSAILQTTDDLVVEHDLARLLQTIVERAAGLLGATGGGLYLCEPEEKQVRCVVSFNTRRDYTGTLLKYGEGAAGRVALTGEPLIINDYSAWEGRAPAFEKDRPFNAVLSVPLKWRDELLGVLHVLQHEGERTFNEQDQQVVAAFASQAAAAIYNARLIEDVRRHNRILSALQEATLALMTHLDLTAALQEIISQAARLVDASHGYIYMLDREDGTFTVKVATGVLSAYVGSSLQQGEGMAGRIWQTGKPMVVDDYHSWDKRATTYDQTEFHAVTGVPLTVGGEVVGVLGLAYLEPGRHFSPVDVDLLERFAPLASIALENARLYTRGQEELAARKQTEAALEESRTRLAGIIESAMDAVISVDSDERIVLFNAAAERTFRCSPDEAIGQPLNRFIPNRFHGSHSEHLRRYGQTGITKRHMGQMAVVTGRRVDGEEFPLEASISRTTVANGNLLTVILRDVTERQRAEALQAAVYEISEAANRAASLDEFYGSLHAIIGQVMSARNFYIALYDAESDLMSFVYHQDETDDMWDNTPVKPRRGVTEYVLRTGQPLFCDAARFGQLLKAGEVELIGVPSELWLGVPLIVENKTIGVMAVQDYYNPRAYGSAELHMLEFVSAQAAKAIERTRLLAEIRQHDRVLSALQEATITLMRELELDDVLETILALAAQLMNTLHGYIFLVEPDERCLKMRLGLGINAQYVGSQLEPGEGLAGRVWQAGLPLVVPDYHTWAGRSPHFETVAFHAMAGVPLTGGGKVIGVLGVDYLEEGYTISSEGVDLLNRFGQLASIALENARLYQSAQNELAERTLVEEKLRSSEERFRSLVEHGADQISLLTPDGTLLYENPTDIQPLSYPRGHFIGQNIFSLVHPDDTERARGTWQQVVDQPGVSVRASFRLRHADGSWRWMEGTATNLLDNRGVGAIVINYHDSSQRVEAEQEIRRLNAELEQRVRARTAELEAANKELEAFSYSVSHDLRAPLRAIDGYTRLLASDYGDLLPPEAHEYLKNIREGGRHMTLLISDMLALSRLTRHVLTYQLLNLSNIAQAIADELQRSAPGRHVDFVIARGLAAEGDPGLIQILLQNLIGNAWKFSSKREHARIEFGSLPSSDPPSQGEEKRGGGVYFVRDNGAGFDMAHADTLFRAFQRLHTDTDFEGTGIGLTIVQRITERHGGRVWAEGEVDKGATFYFTL
jgi:PAS domain S-box-containing protein